MLTTRLGDNVKWVSISCFLALLSLSFSFRIHKRRRACDCECGAAKSEDLSLKKHNFSAFWFKKKKITLEVTIFCFVCCV